MLCALALYTRNELLLRSSKQSFNGIREGGNGLAGCGAQGGVFEGADAEGGEGGREGQLSQ